MAMVGFDASDDEAYKRMMEMFGPSHVDQMFRQALGACWMGLPRDKRNVDELERQVHRFIERALRDAREDFDEFMGGCPICC